MSGCLKVEQFDSIFASWLATTTESLFSKFRKCGQNVTNVIMYHAYQPAKVHYILTSYS